MREIQTEVSLFGPVVSVIVAPEVAQQIAIKAIKASAYVSVTPLPDDEYRVTMKDEHQNRELLVSESERSES